MDWLNSQITPADVIGEYDKFEFHDEGAKVFCPNESLTLNLPDWLASQNQGNNNHRSGNILLVPYETEKPGANRQDLINIADRWSIPPPIFRALVGLHRFGADQPCQFTTRQGVKWYHYPIPIIFFEGTKDEISHILVAFCLKASNYVSENSAPVLNTLVFSPRPFSSEVEKVIQKSVGIADSIGPELDALRFLIILFEAATYQWIHHCNFMYLLSVTQLKRFLDTRGNLLSADAVEECGTYLREIRQASKQIKRTLAILRHLEETCSTLTSAENGHLKDREECVLVNIKEAILHQLQMYLAHEQSYDELSHAVHNLRATFDGTVQANNARYIRLNTISLRRLAEINILESTQVQKLAQQSAKDSRDMKRLAYLTMAFLPSTFVAAFFSTPFMTLDDDLSFKAWHKLWIYFLVSGIMTGAAFAVSIIWDKLHLEHQSEAKDATDEGGDNVDITVDRQVLEPPVFQRADFDKTLKDIMKGIKTRHPEASDGETGNASDQESSIHNDPGRSGE